MERKKITANFSVSSQLSLEDIAFLKDEGIKTIVCNRPDGEDPGQLEHEKIAQEAIKNGLEFHFMPVISGQMTPKDGDNFAEIIADAPEPIHAYCRTGTRCSILWSLSELKAGTPRETILQKTSQAGYDLSKSI
jgi:sulfide:quinone oxidoreductase